MSNLSTQVFGDMNYLYEHIANRDAQQLNENSEHYDAEATELVEDIFYNISYSMASEGYSANGILDFLSKATEEDILEKYYDCSISEGLVSEDYILEQLEIIDEGIGSALVKLGRGAVKGSLGFVKRLSTAGSGAMKGGGGVRDALGAMGKSTQRAIKQSGAVTKVKDLAKGAKAALTSPTAKKIGLGAAALGAATGAGYLGGKMSGAGGNQPSPTSAKPAKPSTQTPAAPAPILPSPSGSGGGRGSGAGGGGGKPTPAKAKAKTPDKGPAGETPMQQWARLHPGLASKVKSGQSGYGEISQKREKPGPYEKKDQTPTTGPEASEAQKSQAGADVAAILAKQKEKQKEVKASTQKESYNAYDLILEYLFDNGHADTIAEAEYVMTELDENFVNSLVETYKVTLLAEEVELWVNELVNEGYDLSEYTWDDMVDQYFTEAKYGTKKGRHELGLKIAHGKDVGKKGSGFEKIVSKASQKYGKKRATKIAAAAMWKNLGK